MSNERETVYSVQYFRQYPNGDREAIEGGTIETDLEVQLEKARNGIDGNPYQGAEILKEERDDNGNIFPPGGFGNPVIVQTFEPNKIVGLGELDNFAEFIDLDDPRSTVKDVIVDAVRLKTDRIDDVTYVELLSGKGGGTHEQTLFTANVQMRIRVAGTESMIDAFFSLNCGQQQKEIDRTDYILNEFEVICENYRVVD